MHLSWPQVAFLISSIVNGLKLCSFFVLKQATQNLALIAPSQILPNTIVVQLYRALTSIFMNRTYFTVLAF
jgi:hypothetical protein